MRAKLLVFQLLHTLHCNVPKQTINPSKKSLKNNCQQNVSKLNWVFIYLFFIKYVFSN